MSVSLWCAHIRIRMVFYHNVELFWKYSIMRNKARNKAIAESRLMSNIIMIRSIIKL